MRRESWVRRKGLRLTTTLHSLTAIQSTWQLVYHLACSYIHHVTSIIILSIRSESITIAICHISTQPLALAGPRAQLKPCNVQVSNRLAIAVLAKKDNHTYLEWSYVELPRMEMFVLQH